LRIAEWWRHKSGKAKTVTVLAVVLIAQIGLCFSTEPVMHWLSPFFPRIDNDPMESLGLMIWQAMFCLLTIGMIFVASVFWLPGLKDAKKQEKRNND